MATVYEIITDKTASAIEVTGVLPWKKPWRSFHGQDAFPKNLVSRRAYRRINSFLLGMMPYQSVYWLTFKQATEFGGQVKKGEKGMPIVFWNKLEIEDERTGKTQSKGYLRYYTVFNVEQCEGVESPEVKEIEWTEGRRIENCEKIVDGFTDRPAIHEGRFEASYHPLSDSIRMPRRQAFRSFEEFYWINWCRAIS